MSDWSRIDLAYAFALPPRRALEYFRGKGFAITFDWDELWAEAHARAFTVAKAMRQDVLATLRAEVDRALAEGITLEQFTRELRPRLERLGWWGTTTALNRGGIAQVVQLGSVRRLETIYRTNVQTAYNAGRWAAFTAARASHPYLTYIAVLDQRTRRSHRLLHGRTYHIDDPFWRYYYPPNGFRCRCRVRAHSADDLQRRGIAVSESGPYLQPFDAVDAASGHVYPSVRYRAPGMPEAISPDRGWAYNPGAAWQTPFAGR